jgi:hypothetical protein
MLLIDLLDGLCAKVGGYFFVHSTPYVALREALMRASMKSDTSLSSQPTARAPSDIGGLN